MCVKFFILFLLPIALFAEDILPIAIVGSGPAGLSAALAASRERVETHLFLGNRPGGPLNEKTCLSNWPGSMKGKGNIVMERLLYQVERYDTYMHEEEIVSIDFASYPFRLFSSSGATYFAKALVLANGSVPNTLRITGEQEYMGRGIEIDVYKKDASRFAGKNVVVVGGGVDAMKKALIAAKTAEKVTVLIRKEAMQKPYMEKRLLSKGKGKIEILHRSEVLEIFGDEKGLTHIDVVTEKGILRNPVDALILAVGISPNNRLVQGKLELDEKGCVVLQGRTQRTSIPGVFAAGTLTDSKYRQAAISAGDGLKAGYDAVEFLERGLPHLAKRVSTKSFGG